MDVLGPSGHAAGLRSCQPFGLIPDFKRRRLVEEEIAPIQATGCNRRQHEERRALVDRTGSGRQACQIEKRIDRRTVAPPKYACKARICREIAPNFADDPVLRGFARLYDGNRFG